MPYNNGHYGQAVGGLNFEQSPDAAREESLLLDKSGYSTARKFAGGGEEVGLQDLPVRANSVRDPDPHAYAAQQQRHAHAAMGSVQAGGSSGST